MRRLPFCVAAVASVVLSTRAGGQEITERDLIARVEASPAAAAARLRIDEARARARVRRALNPPTVTYTREDAADVRDDFLLVRQELPVTGARRFLRSAANATVMAAEADTEHFVRRLRGDARLAFVGLLAAQERAGALEQGVVDLDALVRVLRAREQQGDTAPYDRLRAERETAEVRADLAAERADIVGARARLAPFIPVSPDLLAAIARGSLNAPEPLGLDQLLATIEKRPDYRAAIARVEAAEFELRAASRQRVPEPAVVGGTKRTATGGFGDTGYTLGVEARLPLFGAHRAAVAVARGALTIAQAERDALRVRLKAEGRGAYEGARLRRAQALAYQTDVAAIGAELARIARVAYDEGERGILELLDAYRAALGARVRAIALRADARAASIELEVLTGNEVVP
jgi:cobalt-zinc-cadmium efflux system outer membrane protein